MTTQGNILIERGKTHDARQWVIDPNALYIQDREGRWWRAGSYPRPFVPRLRWQGSLPPERNGGPVGDDTGGEEHGQADTVSDLLEDEKLNDE